ncbi:MAG: signal peptide peptidase SppA [Phycisphaerae bacterium]
MTRFGKITLALALLSVLSATPVAVLGQAEAPAETAPATENAPAGSETADRQEESLPDIAHVRMSGQVLEGPPQFKVFGSRGEDQPLAQWLQRLARIRNDEKIDAVAIEVDGIRAGWAQAQEIADALRRLDEEKPVYTYIQSGGPVQYLIASAGREVAMEPAGNLHIVGVSAEMTFFRGMLNKLGIRPQFVQIGKYKGASEPLTNTEPSPELKKVYDWLMDGLYDQLCSQIARQRDLSIPHVKHAIDQGPLDSAAAKEVDFVDRLVPRIDWRDKLMERIADEADADGARWSWNHEKRKQKDIDTSNPFALLSALLGGRSEPRIPENTIAVIYAEGMIVSGTSGESIFGQKVMGDRSVIDLLDKVRKNDNVKAVVLRVDSPGGSALASEMIYQAVKKCAEEKPVIVTMSGMAASGGYYIACGGDYMIADPATIVGSIGVVSGKLAVDGLFKKIGVSTYSVTRGKHAGMYLSRPWTEEEKKVVRDGAERIYKVFASRVKEARRDKIEDISDIAQGRVFTGKQAKENGLVDDVGGLRKAITVAQQRAKLKQANFIFLPRPKTLADILTGGGNTQSSLDLTAGQLRMLKSLSNKVDAASYLMTALEQLDRENVLTVLPQHLEIR